MQIPIKTDRNRFVLKWSDDAALRRYAFYQHDNFQPWFEKSKPRMLQPEQLSFRTVEILLWQIQQQFWRETSAFARFSELPQDATIIDVGSGIGIMDLCLAMYLKASKQILVDRDCFTLNESSLQFVSTAETIFQNSWTPVLDAIKTTGIEPSRFSLLDPSDQWPPNVDLVMSNFSWGWHYSSDIYLKRTVSALKPGGIVVLDILTLEPSSTELIGELSEKLKCTPKILSFDGRRSSVRCKAQFPNPTEKYGGKYLWKNMGP